MTAPKRLGDPHLGRRFNKGVPLARRGERELMVREDFVRQLDPAGADVHICMGDLFDKPQVSYDDLLFAAQAYMAAAVSNPRTTFYIIQGNHDDSRDLSEVTAWDVFGQLVRGVQNIQCVIHPMISPDLVLLPWSPTLSAVEMLGEAAKAIKILGPKVAYGHWDVDPRSSPHNLIPTRELAELGITTAYTGHIHKPDSFRRDGVDVTVVGSMQPYAQGEDGQQCDLVRYITLTLDQLDEVKDILSGACVRLQLQPGEQAPETIPDCRSWDVQRMRPVEVEEAPADISLDGFDTTQAAKAALDAHEIVPEVREQIETRWTETFGRDLA
ncbi:metallophosphoesterase [Methylorubrum suomiense]|uniref:Calcineurin-like phosphoesterase domain-containing protein n=1 Tax=Methylorubrum suomiense TaxID=144191 RepID=A0ABQ4V0J3_9HYPH|nr:metallophosphoesterase [Methylorubrum suomiense]GJE78121.1 hypothetical protein BGCPKDLD_4732 [Methylorubrum suomiense]